MTSWLVLTLAAQLNLAGISAFRSLQDLFASCTVIDVVLDHLRPVPLNLA